MTDLDPLGAGSSASGINNKGQVVGYSTTPGGAQHAFLYADARMLDLNTLIDTNSGWTLQLASAINDNGQIVGRGAMPSSSLRAFLLTPRPVLQNLRLPLGEVRFELEAMTGFTYRVEYALSFPLTNWITLTNIVLPTSPFPLVDPSLAEQRFYRAVQIP